MDLEFNRASEHPPKPNFLVRLAVSALLVALVCAGLVNFVEPNRLGIESESNRILYVGGLGLLAGFAGLVAVLSLLAMAVQKVTAHRGPATRTATAFAILLGLLLLAILLLRFAPR
jgi:hypothetical protein